jgi:hypothetical protein
MQKNHQDFFNFKAASQQDDGFEIAPIFLQQFKLILPNYR